MEQTVETNADGLLNGVTGIIKRYEAQWQKTGEKYNLFKVASIAHKEVIMCRVLADLMNPQGKHGQGSRYLKLFWETIAPKLPSILALDIEHTRVATERVTDDNRRIDIALDDGKVFVPIEVKIRAGDQHSQAADYFKFAQTKNKAERVPVLYLTVDGHEPSDASKDNIGKGDYVCLSFKDDILDWLEACARDEATEKTVPVRENLRQLIAAIKSLCGKSEDTEMENAIFKLVTQSDDTVRAALAISGVANFREQVLKTFTGASLALVKASFPKATMQKEDYGDGRYEYMDIPVREGNYVLQVNYDWTTVWLNPSDSCKTDSASQEWADLNKKMTELFKFEPPPYEKQVWVGEDIAWPSLESYVNNDDLDVYCAHLSKLSPQEVAQRIVSIAQELEKA
jgi:hypothetical protein